MFIVLGDLISKMDKCNLLFLAKSAELVDLLVACIMVKLWGHPRILNLGKDRVMAILGNLRCSLDLFLV